MTRLNPYLDPTPWGTVRIGGLTIPGTILSIDGADRPDDWEVQKATDKSGATTVWKGTKVAEDIKVTVALVDSTAVDAYYNVRDTLRPPGLKPPSHVVENAIINWSGITQVTTKNVTAPKWDASGGYWKGEITLIEYAPPKPASTGKAAPADPAGTYNRTAPDHNAATRARLGELLAQVNKP